MTFARQRNTLTAITAVLTMGVLAGCSTGGGGGTATEGAGAGGTASVRIALVPAVVTIQPAVAKDQGIFAKNGIDATITPSQNLGTFAPALGSQFDIAYGTPADVIQAASKGFKITVIAGAYADSSKNKQGALIAGKSSGVTTVSALKGKRIAVPTLSGTLYTSLLAELMKAGVGADGATIVEVPFPNMLDQLDAGKIDAALAPPPFMTAMLSAGNVALADPFLEAGDPTIVGMWIADAGWASSNLSTVQAFRKSLTEANAFMGANDAKTRSIIVSSLGIPAPVVAQVPLPDWQPTVQSKDLEPWVAILKNTKQLSGDGPNLKDLVFDK